MLLKILTEKKRKDYKQKENEAIQFIFDLKNDEPGEVAKEMVGTSGVVSIGPQSSDSHS